MPCGFLYLPPHPCDLLATAAPALPPYPCLLPTMATITPALPLCLHGTPRAVSHILFHRCHALATCSSPGQCRRTSAAALPRLPAYLEHTCFTDYHCLPDLYLVGVLPATSCTRWLVLTRTLPAGKLDMLVVLRDDRDNMCRHHARVV